MPVEGRSLASGELEKGGKEWRLAMSLATPDKIRGLQIKLYRKAKNEPEFRFYPAGLSAGRIFSPIAFPYKM
jgi:hypothetical protein